MTTTQYIVQFLVKFLSLFPGYTFMAGCYFLWRQTYRISFGHKWLGQIAWLGLVLINMLYTLFPLYAHKFRPIVNCAMTLWVVYNALYFQKYPIPWQYMQSGSALRPGETHYIPKTRMGTLLFQPVNTRSFWFGSFFKWVAVVAFFVMMSAYFIQQLADLAVWSDRRVEQALKSVDAKIATEASKVKQQVQQQVQKQVETAVDTLKKQQSTDQQTTKDVQKQVDDNTNSINKMNRRKRTGPAVLIIKPPESKRIPGSIFPLPAPKKTSLMEPGMDSSYSARNYQ